LGAAGVGLVSALVGAWGAISVFVGPDFGYRPSSASAWSWTTQNWLLHLIPGAVAVVAGLLIMSLSPMRRAGAGGGGLGLGALLIIAAGAWFVIGPALWPTFESGAPFVTGSSAGTSFINQLGSSLGPGILLAMLGGMALKAGIARPAVAVGDVPVAAGEAPVVTGVGAAAPALGERRDRSVTATQPAAVEADRVEASRVAGGGPASEVAPEIPPQNNLDRGGAAPASG
jgi:hypothetical protein